MLTTLIVAALFTAEKPKPFSIKLKETSGEVTERKPGEFVKTRAVASNVRSGIEKTDFADKPWRTRITWTSQQQESKIYSTKERAEQAKDWLPPSKVAGSSNTMTVTQSCTATLYHRDGKWWLDEISWIDNLSGIETGRYRASGRSTKLGDKTPWSAVFNEKAVSEKAPPAKKGK